VKTDGHGTSRSNVVRPKYRLRVRPSRPGCPRSRRTWWWLWIGTS